MSSRRKGKPQQRIQSETLLKKDDGVLQSIHGQGNGFDLSLPFPIPAHIDHLCKLILEKMEPEQDLLTCGNCQREFLLSDITKFIQHKVTRCNKENIEPLDDDGDGDSGEGEDAVSTNVISHRRTSISAPIAHKVATELREKLSPRPCVNANGTMLDLPKESSTANTVRDGSDDGSDAESDGSVVSSDAKGAELEEMDTNENSVIKSPAAAVAMATMAAQAVAKNIVGCDSEKGLNLTKVIKQEEDILETTRKSRAVELVHIAVNTLHTEPGSLSCISCKSGFNSAWALLQHVQKSHGIKVYTERDSEANRSPPPALESARKLPPKTSSSSSSDKLPSFESQVEHHRQTASSNSSHSTPAPRAPPKSPGAAASPASSSDVYSQSPPFPVPRPPLSPVAAFAPGPFCRPPFSPEFSPHEMIESYRRFGPFHPLPPSLDHPMPGFPFRPPGYDGSTSLADYYSKKLQQLAGQPSNPFLNNHGLLPFHTQKPKLPFGGGLSNGPTMLAETVKTSNVSSKYKTCEFCSKEFRFHSNLIVHRRMHTGEKPFKCPLCSHACAQASKLKRHMKIHVQAKSFLANSGLLSSALSTNSEASARSSNGTPDSKSTPYEDGEEDSDEEDLEEEAMAAREARAEEELKRITEQLQRLSRSQALADDEGDEEDEDDLEDDDLDEELLENSSNGRKRRASDSEKGDDKDRPKDMSLSKQQRAEILSEMMDDTGLSRIAEYKEAYSEALRESSSARTSDGTKIKEEESKENMSGGSRSPPEPPRPSTRSSVHSSASKASSHDSSQSADTSVSKKIKLEPSDGVSSPHHNHHPSFPPMDVYPPPRGDIFNQMWLHSPLAMRSSNGKELMNILAPNAVRLQENGMHDSAFCSSPKPPHFSPNLSTSTPTGSLPGVPMRRRNDTCEFCGKIFRNCSNLTVHRRSHTGEKPYKCELCNYACAQSSKLTRHMKTHGRVGMDVFRCKFCNMPFSVASTLEKHMRRCVEKQQREGLLGPGAALSPSSSLASSSAASTP